MILITGAAGKTGQAILKALAPADEGLRVLVRRETQAAELRGLGAHEVVVGDMADTEMWRIACGGVRSIYHICPNMSPDEVGIGERAMNAARQAGVEHFVYHSVLHPQVQEMPHHWNKLQVEAMLFKSGLNFTILQPASYMQNIAGYWKKMRDDGVYAVPYSIHARFSMVDLEDVAHAAAVVIRDGQPHYRAIYELCGAQLLSSEDIAEMAGVALDRQVQAVEQDRSDWERNARAGGMDDFSRFTLLSMFEYYHQNGFTGNANALTTLLGRSPTRFAEYLARSGQ
jgi:uncharacterized protein YbjT (DUF2867 family)